MLATPAGELHTVALRMIADLLRQAGYGVMMLGADVPAPDLAATARRYEPDVVCMSSTMPGGIDGIFVAIDEVQQSWPDAALRDRRPRAQPHALGAGHQRLPARPRGRRRGRRADQARRPELTDSPPHSSGATSASVSENVHWCPARSSAWDWRSPYS